MEWAVASAAEESVSGRVSGHTMTLLGSRVYMFGGEQPASHNACAARGSTRLGAAGVSSSGPRNTMFASAPDGE